MASTSETEALRWEAVVEADRDLFEGVASEGTTAFPEGRAPWVMALDGPEILIGRSAADRGVRPAIDLSGEHEDVGVSREHALLVAQPDGSYAVVDLGSRNGTTLNGDPAPLPPHEPVPVGDGDRICVGLWTSIAVRVVDRHRTGRLERQS